METGDRTWQSNKFKLKSSSRQEYKVRQWRSGCQGLFESAVAREGLCEEESFEARPKRFTELYGILLGKCEAPEKALRQTEYSVRQVRFQDSEVEGRS